MYVLVAEDDRNACEMYSIALKSRGHKVAITHDGKECLEYYEKHLESPGSNPADVVILDLQMPVLSGFEVMKAILNIKPDQRIIIASAHIKDTLRQVVKDFQRIIELVEKPFEPRELVEIVENQRTARYVQTIKGPAKMEEIQGRRISGKGISRGLENLQVAIGPKLMPLVRAELDARGMLSDARSYPAEELLQLLEKIFGDSNGLYFMQFFIDFLDPV